jgi:UDP-N-acetylmuramoylalanine--D-glutamate ligase
VPPFDPEVEGGFDLWVVEVSSYQATDITSTPPVVAVTSLQEDHVNWHGDAESYFRDKLSMCTQPGAHLTVASRESPALIERRAMLGPVVKWVSPEPATQWAEPLGLMGRHNLVNAEIARECLDAMGLVGNVDDEAFRRAAVGFQQLQSRLQLVSKVGGVDFVDDSLSTNVLPTIAALRTFSDRRVALIAGGFDRGIDYSPLAAGLAERSLPTLVLTVYSTGPRIQAALAQRSSRDLEVRPCADLESAVKLGWDWAQPDGVVLLSPAAASFDAFDDYRHRATAFRAAIERLPASRPAGA